MTEMPFDIMQLRILRRKLRGIIKESAMLRKLLKKHTNVTNSRRGSDASSSNLPKQRTKKK